MRPIVDLRKPDRSAIDARDHVCGVVRGGLQGGHHHVFDLLSGNRGWPARTGFVDQSIAARFDEPAAPLTHRWLRHLLLGGDLLVGEALRAGQHRSATATPAKTSAAAPTGSTSDGPRH